MKKLVKINNKSNIELYSSLCDGFIIGLEDFSIDFDEFFSCAEIETLVNNTTKEIFVSINKNIFNSELNELEKVLLFLSKLSVKILFYDMSILYLKKKNNLNVDLVWNQTHMVTNYNTCNYYYDRGCKYAFISGEITLDEIIEISKNTKSHLLVEVVGKQIMAYSKRKLLTNYYFNINKDYNGQLKLISEHDKDYLIKETPNGTMIRTSDILNGIPVIPKLLSEDIEYIVVDEYNIDNNKILKVLKIIDDIIHEKNIEKNVLKSKDLLGDNTSFLFKKTIYKVKGGK